MPTEGGRRDANPWAVVFYETARGNRPTELWLAQQDTKVQARFARIFDLLEEHGTGVHEPYVAHLRDKLWEARLEHQRVQYRLLYFPAPHWLFVMLHGFVKKTQRTPSREMDVPEQRMRDYLERRSEEG